MGTCSRLRKPPRRTCTRRRRSKFYKNTAALPKTITLPEGRNASGYWGRSVRSLQAKKINTQSAPRRARQRGDRCVATGLEPMEWSKTKRATSLRGAGWKQRSFPFKRKGRRGEGISKLFIQRAWQGSSLRFDDAIGFALSSRSYE